MLKTYIRDENKKPFGIMIALDKNKIGISICNSKDIWKKNVGENIAIGRALKNENEWKNFIFKLGKNNINSKRSNLIMNQMNRFINRVSCYFKDQV